MVFGSEVEGLSVLTHTHTPPLLTSLTHAIPLSPRVAKCSSIAICVLAIAAHLHAGNCCCYSRTSIFASSQLLLFTHEPRKRCSFLMGFDCFSHAQEFLGLTHMIFFCGLVDGAAVSLPHELNYGFGVDCYSCPGRNSVNSFCRKVCVSLPVASLSQMDY